LKSAPAIAGAGDTDMPAIRLTTKRVEKPWGRRDLWPAFAPVPAGGAPVGEIWFEVPGEPGGRRVRPELLIKYLFTSDRLSVQIHPDDAGARAKGHACGKDEAWVILDAEPHASIAIGTLRPMTQEQLRAASVDGSIEKLLDWKAVEKDDSFYTTAGTIHAIGPGLTLIEVQQNVDVTYRLYDYGSARELHLDDAVAASNPMPYVAAYQPYDLAPGRGILADGPKFVLERWRRSGSGTLASDGRPIWLVPLSGSGAIDGGAFEAGGVWLAEGETALTLNERADMLVAYPKSGVIESLWS
jgi:mannose-6-phosphate isomerase